VNILFVHRIFPELYANLAAFLSAYSADTIYGMTFKEIKAKQLQGVNLISCHDPTVDGTCSP
jgi:hypothetical protein